MTIQGQARQAVKEARENIEKRAEHTPGPWAYEFEKMGGYDCMSDSYEISAGEQGHIAEIDFADSDSPPGEKEANARLICAAPDLLEAVYAMVAGFEDTHAQAILEEGKEEYEYHKTECSACRALRLASAAISKAKGE